MSDSSGWTHALLAALRRVRLPAVRVVATDNVLDVVLALDDGRRLEVRLQPHVEGARVYDQTARFQVSYRGVRDLGAAQQRVLDALVEVISRLEHRLPEAWHGYRCAGEAPERPEPELTARFPFVQVDRADTGAEVLVRLTGRCNQGCPFCSAPQSHGVSEAPAEDVRRCIDWVATHMPEASVTLTGGEPTLHRDFPTLARYALASGGLGRVLVQTNAVLFASASREAMLPRHERLAVFVSLHAMDPEIYDRCTGSRGLLPRALEGLRRLVEAGHAVTVNTVVSAHNVDHVAAMPARLRKHLDALPLPTLHYSVLICPPERPEAAELLVEYSRLAPALETALEAAETVGFTADPLLGSTHASPPPCVLSATHRSAAARRPVPGEGETGWTKAEGCPRCALTRSCLGVPNAYATRFGLQELRPLNLQDGVLVDRE